jgi:hypothetical protein
LTNGDSKKRKEKWRNCQPAGQEHDERHHEQQIDGYHRMNRRFLRTASECKIFWRFDLKVGENRHTQMGTNHAKPPRSLQQCAGQKEEELTIVV